VLSPFEIWLKTPKGWVLVFSYRPRNSNSDPPLSAYYTHARICISRTHARTSVVAPTYLRALDSGKSCSERARGRRVHYHCIGVGSSLEGNNSQGIDGLCLFNWARLSRRWIRNWCSTSAYPPKPQSHANWTTEKKEEGASYFFLYLSPAFLILRTEHNNHHSSS
jgi:hypothetical protein